MLFGLIDLFLIFMLNQLFILQSYAELLQAKPIVITICWVQELKEKTVQQSEFQLETTT